MPNPPAPRSDCTVHVAVPVETEPPAPQAPFPAEPSLLPWKPASTASTRGVGLFSCCPLGPDPIPVSVSRGLCLGHGASWDGGQAPPWLPQQRACGSHGAGARDSLDCGSSLGFEGSIWGPGRASGDCSNDGPHGTRVFLSLAASAPAVCPPHTATEPCLGSPAFSQTPRGCRPSRDHRKNALW